MSLASLYARHTLPEGVTADDEMARAILAALPTTSALPDHDDVRSVAAWVALCKHADGMPILEAVAYAWTASRDESIRDAARDAVPASDDDGSWDALVESLPDRTTLPRAATYSPEAPYTWTVSDTVTVALSLLDDNARAVLALVLAAPEESWTVNGVRGGLPAGAYLCSAATLAGLLPEDTDPQSRAGRRLLALTREALASLREACAVVVAWSANVRARDYWTDDARAVADAVADAVAVALDARGTRQATGTSTSGPASPVVIRYRDTIGDPWQQVTREHVETPATDDAPAVVVLLRYLLPLTDDAARATLAASSAVRPFRPEQATREADRWADLLTTSAGAVRKGRSRKGSRVGSTGPTTPVGARPARTFRAPERYGIGLPAVPDGIGTPCPRSAPLPVVTPDPVERAAALAWWEAERATLAHGSAVSRARVEHVEQRNALPSASRSTAGPLLPDGTLTRAPRAPWQTYA